MSGSKCNSIVNELICKLRAGFRERQGALPGETDLAAQFNASRETIRQVKRILEAAGVISSRKGRGTFLAEVSSCLTGSIGVIVTGRCWQSAFESAMSKVFAGCSRSGCCMCVTDCSADGEVDRIVKTKGAVMRYAAYGVSGLIWQVDAADISETNWPSCRDETLSIAAAVGMKVVIVSNDMLRLRGTSGFDAVGSDWFDCGRRVGGMLADSGATTVHAVGMVAGVARDDSLLAGLDFELHERAKIWLHGAMDECLDLCQRGGCPANAESFVFFASGMAERFLLSAKKQGLDFPADVKFVQLGWADPLSPVDGRIVTLRRDCDATALAALKCMVARLNHPACSFMEVMLPLA